MVLEAKIARLKLQIVSK